MKFDIVRAWKDETYRQTLGEDMLNDIPANPAGELELSDTSLDAVCGGDGGLIQISSGRLFSVNLFANPLTQTCFQNQSSRH